MPLYIRLGSGGSPINLSSCRSIQLSNRSIPQSIFITPSHKLSATFYPRLRQAANCSSGSLGLYFPFSISLACNSAALYRKSIKAALSSVKARSFANFSFKISSLDQSLPYSAFLRNCCSCMVKEGSSSIQAEAPLITRYSIIIEVRIALCISLFFSLKRRLSEMSEHTLSKCCGSKQYPENQQSIFSGMNNPGPFSSYLNKSLMSFFINNIKIIYAVIYRSQEDRGRYSELAHRYFTVSFQYQLNTALVPLLNSFQKF